MRNHSQSLTLNFVNFKEGNTNLNAHQVKNLIPIKSHISTLNSTKTRSPSRSISDMLVY